MKALNDTELFQVAGGYFDALNTYDDNSLIMRIAGGVLGIYLTNIYLPVMLGASLLFPFNYFSQAIIDVGGALIGSEIGQNIYNFQLISTQIVKERVITP